MFTDDTASATAIWAEKRATLAERCALAAQLVDQESSEAWIVWCDTNAEADALKALLPGAVEVRGDMTPAEKERKLNAFSDGEARVIITKADIAGFGLNWQHCGHVTLFPSHSFEQYYQCIRRCWRFGRQGPVQVDIVTTEGERGVLANLQRKSAQADRMFSSLVSEMGAAMAISRAATFTKPEETPSWLCSIN